MSEMSRTPDIEVSVRVRCTPRDAWLVVANPAAMAPFSPELHSVAMSVEPPLPVGAQFAGTNRRGRRQWSTSCRVVESAVDSSFAYDVTYIGRSVARWRYVVSEDDAGCRVTEQWWDRRGRLVRFVGEWGTGVHDRQTHNRQTMTATLERLRSALELDER